MLGIILSALTNRVEVLLGSQHTAAEPNSVPLHDVLRDCTLDFGLLALVQALVKQLQTSVDSLLKIFLQSRIEAFEERGASGKHDVVIEFDAILNRTRLDSVVHNLLNRLDEIFVNKFLNKNKKPVCRLS